MTGNTTRGDGIGILIPEYPGQTHSFFWREISALRAEQGRRVQVFSTRAPAQPVAHDWVAEAPATYLYPPPATDLAPVLAALAGKLPRFLADPANRAVMRRPRAWALLVMAVRLGRLCRAAGIGHLHVHSCADAALVAALCNRLYGLPYSLVLHGPLIYFGGDQAYKWQHAAFAFAITRRLRGEVLEAMPWFDEARLAVVPMGVDTTVFAPAPAAAARDDGAGFKWFSCGRLVPGKGFDVVIKAASLLRQAVPELPFSIEVAGEDADQGAGYHRDLDAAITAAELAATVRLLGAIPQERVLSALQGSDGFVLASREEALGVAYMEAMACGLPTVGTRTGGVPELIEDGRNGFLVTVDDAPALAAAMRRVMEDPDLGARLSRAARDTVVSEFSAARSARELVLRIG